MSTLINHFGNIMKKLMTLLSLIVLTGTLSAQGITSPQDLKIQEFQSDSDPFTKYELMLDNPCEDSVYKELQKMDIDEMSERQFEIYKQKDEACNEYMKTDRAMEASDRTAASVEKSMDSLNVLYVISGIATLGSVIYLFTL